jgi:hypothetical protein
MAPSATEVETQAPVPIVAKSVVAPDSKDYVTGLTKSASYPTPLSYSGTLDSHEHFDVTSVIGREFPKLQITDILNDDAKLRDLAILVSQRGVVFFRNQDITIEQQKVLGQKLGELTGKPATSKVLVS